MPGNYFLRLKQQQATRLWVNNPSLSEARQAVAAGAVSCTTNPSFAARIQKSEPAAVAQAIDQVIASVADDDAAAHRVQQELAARIMPVFLPFHEARPGAEGFVSVQGDPFKDHDTPHIVHESFSDRKRLPPNLISKIPTTAAGLKAMDELLRAGMPVIATEVFALAQAVAAAEVHRRVQRETGRAPALVLTHITGIYDEYLEKLVAREGLPIAPAILQEAGCAVARAERRLCRERGYRVILLGGGARAPRHFTEMVGGDFQVTLNWSTIEELQTMDPPPAPRLDAETPAPVIRELLGKLPDFRRAWELDGMREEDFAEFGPVQYFLGMFRAGWKELRAAIGERRKAKARKP